jgi:hypothetical protein
MFIVEDSSRWLVTATAEVMKENADQVEQRTFLKAKKKIFNMW